MEKKHNQIAHTRIVSRSRKVKECLKITIRHRQALIIVKPATVVRSHRKRFASYWTRLSHNSPGRPGTDREIRELIRRMAKSNPLWGAPRVHGELLKLGINISERTVSRWMPRRVKPPSQTWRAFLDNHVGELVSMDFFTV